jgi:hypothetical protein
LATASEDNYTFNVVRKILQVVVPALPAKHMHAVMNVFVGSFGKMELVFLDNFWVFFVDNFDSFEPLFFVFLTCFCRRHASPPTVRVVQCNAHEHEGRGQEQQQEQQEQQQEPSPQNGRYVAVFGKKIYAFTYAYLVQFNMLISLDCSLSKGGVVCQPQFRTQGHGQEGSTDEILP